MTIKTTIESLIRENKELRRKVILLEEGRKELLNLKIDNYKMRLEMDHSIPEKVASLRKEFNGLREYNAELQRKLRDLGELKERNIYYEEIPLSKYDLPSFITETSKCLGEKAKLYLRRHQSKNHFVLMLADKNGKTKIIAFVPKVAVKEVRDILRILKKFDKIQPAAMGDVIE